MRYKFMKKEFNTERELLEYWNVQREDYKKYYTIFYNNSTMKAYYIKDKEHLCKVIKGTNDIKVEFPNSNKIYTYRNIDKIDFNKIDNVTFTELRGWQSNIISWVRIYNINGALVAIC